MMVQLVLFPDEFPYHFFLSRETNPHMFNNNSVWLDSFVNTWASSYSFHRVKDYAVMQIVLCLPYPIFE